MTLILAIESSCDETGASVVKDGQKVLSNIVWSQYELHKRYSGVVPEIASRAHLERIYPVVKEAIDKADINLEDLDAIAVGNRPGLIGSLLVGLSAAKALSWALGKPLIGIDHVQAHLYAARLNSKNNDKLGSLCTKSTSTFPSPIDNNCCELGLVVSGGHTSLYKINSAIDTKLLGSTIDDAVGEAYDKAAVILNLDDYPGGPAIDKLAKEGDAKAYDLPRSRLGKDSLDFSFSGLKTALLYTVCGKPQKQGKRGKKPIFPHSADELTNKQKADLASSFQAAAIDVIIMKIKRAITQLEKENVSINSLIVGGGVSANSLLRKRILQLGEKMNIKILLPKLDLCMDNAAMIGGLAYHYYVENKSDSLDLRAIATTKM